MWTGIYNQYNVLPKYFDIIFPDYVDEIKNVMMFSSEETSGVASPTI